MRKLLFYVFWILIALALPYSLKAQSEPLSGARVHPMNIEAHGVGPVTMWHDSGVLHRCKLSPCASARR
jgi:hypothetical protein